MSSSRFRAFIVVFIALAAGAGSLLLVAGSALADVALFRIERRWHQFPSPPVTPGGAGMYQGYIFPYYLDTPAKGYLSPPETAIVAPGNPIGGAFSLPEAFFYSIFTGSNTPKTAWPGYTTTFFYHAYNGPAKFEPNFGPTATYRMVFPTTGGNPTPNFGLGNPATPTTTFGGRYDISRGGSLWVTPGPNRFGGTFKLFFPPTAHWDQFIYYFTPILYSGYGGYFCFDDGMFDCTPDTFVSEPGTTASYQGTWWLLTDLGKNKATTPTAARASTKPTLTPYGNASYIRRSQHYLNLIHPWTTGYAKAVQAAGNQGTGVITPQATGYDTSLGGATITVKKRNYNQNFNKTLSTLTSSTTTPYTQILKGVTRVVSMVRPRLTWDMAVPLDPGVDPIENIWSPVRMWRLKVFFLPEPGGILMLGVGIASLVGLSRMRRR